MAEEIRTTLLALGTGMATGLIFAYFKLPVPAPITFAGIAGIIGIWLGYSLIK